MSFNAYPGAGIDVAESFLLNMVLKGLNDETLMSVAIPLNHDGTWMGVFSGLGGGINGVHSILFPALGYATFPSFDNLAYTLPKEVAVPEPGTFYLLCAGIAMAFGVSAARKRKPATI